MKTETIKKIYDDNETILVFFLIGLGICLRFFIMSFGYNCDFESYKIVGELIDQRQNVYANTTRYNYGPIFLGIQGFCYQIGRIAGDDYQFQVFRVSMVSILTLTDLGIMVFAYKKYSLRVALLFFLNPVSIFITGFHNQFDNIAVLLALLTCLFYNEEKKLNRRDIGFIVAMSLCLVTKHILFVFPFWLLVSKGLPVIKRILYACVPPIIFLLSFIPFFVGNKEAFNGILHNVFLYRSANNAPLLHGIYEPLHIPQSLYLYIFAAIMCWIGWYFRERDIMYRLLIYLMCLLCFSSSIANQYLVIPLIAICILGGATKYLYSIYMLYFLLFDVNGLNWNLPRTTWLMDSRNSYTIGCIIVVLIILKEIIKEYSRKHGKKVVEYLKWL